MFEVIVKAIESKLNTTFSDEQKEAVTDDITDYLNELERKLHATLVRRDRTDTMQVSSFGNLNLLGPVIKVYQVLEVGGTTDSAYRKGIYPDQRDMIYPAGARPGSVYEVTYEAGFNELDSGVKTLLRDVYIRNKIVGVHISSGALSSLNVEGASVGYGPAVTAANAEQQDGSFTKQELKKLSHLRRLVVR